MTANGIALYFFIAICGFAFGREEVVPWVALILSIALSLASTAALPRLILRATIVTLPLSAWLTLIWIGVGPKGPASFLLYHPPADAPGTLLVAGLGIRFFALALLTLAAIELAGRIKPSFALRLSIPRAAKIILLAATSFTYAFAESVGRAHTALVAANVITARRSVTNFKNGWLLIRSSWISALGIASERLDTKWRYERLPDEVPLARLTKPTIVPTDILWLTFAIATLIAQLLRA